MNHLKNQIIFLFVFFLFSCNHTPEGKQKIPEVYQGNKALEKLEIGMSSDEAMEIAGKPIIIDSLGTGPDENNKQVTRVMWWFGDNQNITFGNDKVISIVFDVKKQDEDYQRITKRAKDSLASIQQKKTIQ